MNDKTLNLLNILTKYPSIPTYHEMVNGRLTENVAVPFDGGDLEITEKIDGSNARVIFVGNEFYIGSREQLLYCAGDRLYNPNQGIVETLVDWARVAHRQQGDMQRGLLVAYFEVYGGKIEAWKQYSSRGEYGFRLFDAWRTGERAWLDIVANRTPEQIVAWREGNNQPWMDMRSHALGAQRVPAYTLPPTALPTSLAETGEWLLSRYKFSSSRLDPDAGGQAEGIVIRNSNRSRIAKLRLEDYRKALRLGGK